MRYCSGVRVERHSSSVFWRGGWFWFWGVENRYVGVVGGWRVVVWWESRNPWVRVVEGRIHDRRIKLMII